MLPEGEAQPPEVFRAKLEQRARALGVLLAPPALQRLSGFLSLLDRERRRTNLTGPLTDSELADHAIESVLGRSLIPDGADVIDVGAGAGFPAMPLAIVRPDLRVTATEPRRKRADFLRLAAREGPVENYAVIESRLDQVPATKIWTVATARAVGQIERALGEARILEAGGLFLAWTTDASDLARRLGRQFCLENQVAVPESRKKVIACFRKADVSRGTSGTGDVRR